MMDDLLHFERFGRDDRLMQAVAFQQGCSPRKQAKEVPHETWLTVLTSDWGCEIYEDREIGSTVELQFSAGLSNERQIPVGDSRASGRTNVVLRQADIMKSKACDARCERPPIAMENVVDCKVQASVRAAQTSATSRTFNRSPPAVKV